MKVAFAYFGASTIISLLFPFAFFDSSRSFITFILFFPLLLAFTPYDRCY